MAALTSAEPKSVLHIRVGSDTWKPTEDELLDVRDAVLRSALTDPRNGIQIKSIGVADRVAILGQTQGPLADVVRRILRDGDDTGFLVTPRDDAKLVIETYGTQIAIYEAAVTKPLL